LKTITGVKDSDTCQINAFSLYSLGTVKRNTLDAIAKSLDHWEGMSIVFYPVIPKRLKRKTVESGMDANVAAAVDADANGDDANDDPSGSDSDVDEDEHDFTADGVLPETLTSLHTVKFAWWLCRTSRNHTQSISISCTQRIRQVRKERPWRCCSCQQLTKQPV
jgi:hypothetical protein